MGLVDGALDRRQEHLPGRGLREQSRTNLDGQQVMFEPQEDQRTQVVVENHFQLLIHFQLLMNSGHNANLYKKR